RRIAYITGKSELRSAQRRLEAFKKTMHQLFPESEELIFEGNFKVEGGRRAAAQIFETQTRKLPTAIVCANDLTAIGAVTELELRGCHIPNDISIIGFDDIVFSGFSKPPLTTVHLPLNELGRRAVECLVNSLEDLNKEGVEIRIPTRLVIRNSTAPAKFDPESP
ncbi:MAG TPA: substrate-binding domain-containing protein, partial [Pyrinomonadaceae bacterium]|nr:substrate-binding domain-containing protein [Pyrinomonadaceae bacterium]